ncbi:hypothetical protein [uncultured Clostridium sp.]|uniref:hypothetical protein n=1 Tax=uncultured Clostridium sp. TaxID=59620 RepID=UPI00260AD0C0|nr:hypothetical protein [uncultured Clostridium sp.]
MKKLLLGIFISLSLGVAACEFDDMTRYFTSGSGLVEVKENVIYVNNMKWWNNMTVEQKEKLANVFRTVSKNHDKVLINEVRDNKTNILLAQFKVWDNEIKVIEK